MLALKMLRDMQPMFDKKFTLKVLFVIILKLILFALSLIPIYLMKILFDDILPSFSLNTLFATIGLILIVTLVTIVIEYISSSFQIYLYNEGEEKFRHKFVSSLFNNDMLLLNQYSSGDVIYRGSTDTSRVVSLAISMLIDLPVQVIYLLVTIFLLIKINYYMFAVSLLLIIIKLLFTKSMAKRFYILNVEKKQREAGLLEAFKQVMDRFLFIKLNRLKDYEIVKYLKKLKVFLESSRSLSLFQTLVNSINGFISSFSQIIVIVLGAFFISRGEITLGLFISFMNILQRVIPPIEYLNSLFFLFKDMVASYQRVSPLMDEKEFILEKKKHDTLYNKLRNVHLRCNNLSFSVEGKQIFNNLDFTVLRQDKISIIGRSGCGKSTFTKVIAGVYRHQGDVILYPDNNSDKPEIGFILEICSLFKGSLKENLTYGTDGKEFTDQEIISVINMAELGDFYAQLSKGLDSEICTEKLSHGEKQRIELARLMLIKPQLIILDEATAGLDPATEEIVWNNFRNSCINSTLIYITHNKNIIYKSDKIIDMAKLIENEIFYNNENDCDKNTLLAT